MQSRFVNREIELEIKQFVAEDFSVLFHPFYLTISIDLYAKYWNFTLLKR